MDHKSLLWLGLAVLTAGCLGGADAKKVDDAQQNFFKEKAARAYSQMFVEAAPELQKSTTSDQFVATMQAFDDAFGQCQPPKKKLDIHTNADSNGFVTSQGFTQDCERATVDETLTIILRNGLAQVQGFEYHGTPKSSATG